jgi:hypothetical protein
MSVRSSVIAAEALALLSAVPFGPAQAGNSFEISALTRSEEHTMHATVQRYEGVVGKWTDGLSRETGEAVVRDLLRFEGLRSHDRWMRRPGSWSPG